MENLPEAISNFFARVNKNPKAVSNVLKVLLIYGALYILFIAGVSYFDITREGIQNFFSQFGAFAIVIFAISVVLIAMTPLPDAPIIASGVLILGAPLGFVVIWLSMTLAAIINFSISKVLGRKFVEKNFPNTVVMIDMFAKHNGIEAIIIARIFTFVTFDMVSYAAGLTNMSFFKYVFAALISMLPIAINYTFLGAGIASQNILSSASAFTATAVFAIFLGYVARAGKKKYLGDSAENAIEHQE